MPFCWYCSSDGLPSLGITDALLKCFVEFGIILPKRFRKDVIGAVDLPRYVSL